MTKALFICYTRCSTCAKARAWLDAHGIAYTERDIKGDNPGVDELAAWHRASGLPIRRFFNTSGQLYRAMKLKDRLPDMTDDEMIALLATDGMLVKRPLLIVPSSDGGEPTVLVGFRQAEWEDRLL
ncbi:arsenate reductase family protein [Bifidobacterium sp. 82T24]|uniref:arsenate reductase family protein n=1 Tax=Bifidobacterium pluvialisilvae TaxID=2834436 RepID=UPI001C55AE0D|nr:arsenate reductase family protein [Bifidobacterium pluvialisilvae]MBW3087304.1 arsenate reductase family protein [Bifidobacterium pluvialisilvae]